MSIDETVVEGAQRLEEIIDKESGNTITMVGHIANREEGQVNRKSTRKRITNSALQNYIWGERK